jgi:hypothetical protein
VSLRVYCLTSDKYRWALTPFAYLFNTYWSSLQPVVIGGFNPPLAPLPKNFAFHSIARKNYPPEKWSDALIQFVSSMGDEYFVLLLEDYWLIRTVDVEGVRACYEYMKCRQEVLRMDLTGDRLYAGGMRDVDSWGHYDIIETPVGTPYQMSLQAGIWNKRRLLDILSPGKTAWQTEIHIAPPESMRVLGTRQWPVRYANAVLKGKLDPIEIRKIPEEHIQNILRMIPEEWKKA